MHFREKEREPANRDQERLEKYGVDGTKIFVCRIRDGVFHVKALGRTFRARNKRDITDIVEDVITERFGIG